MLFPLLPLSLPLTHRPFTPSPSLPPLPPSPFFIPLLAPPSSTPLPFLLSPRHPFINNELIVKCGLVDKRKVSETRDN